MSKFLSAILLLVSFSLTAQIKLNKPDIEAVKNENPGVEIAAVLIDSTFDFFDHALNSSASPDVYQLNISVSEARALNLYFQESIMPSGASLKIYSFGRGNLFAYNSNTLNQELVTLPLEGEIIYIVYEGPKEGASLIISEVGCFLKSTDDVETSGSCEVDINCAEGGEWQNQKRGVLRLMLKAGPLSIFCTGSLINNTARDCKPYVFSSEHCLDAVNMDDLDQTVIYFNYESSNCNSGDGSPSQNIQGMQLKASSTSEEGSDFALFELDENIPLEYVPFFNGWNKLDNPSSDGVSIHHPSGDVKKISTYSTLLATADIPELPNDSYWEVVWEETPNGHGVTEQGSSGSPLFNDEKLIIGNLTGGTSSCSISGTPDYYGKFSLGWDNEIDSAKRLDVWLDPLNTGEDKMPGSYYPCSDSAIQFLPQDSIAILGNPVKNLIKVYVEQKISSEVEIALFSARGKKVYAQSVARNNIMNIEILVQNLRNGMYFLRIQTGTEEYIEKIIIVN